MIFFFLDPNLSLQWLQTGYYFNIYYDLEVFKTRYIKKILIYIIIKIITLTVDNSIIALTQNTKHNLHANTTCMAYCANRSSLRMYLIQEPTPTWSIKVEHFSCMTFHQLLGTDLFPMTLYRSSQGMLVGDAHLQTLALGSL